MAKKYNYYVVAVEPGSETNVKKAIQRKKKIKPDECRVLHIIIPRDPRIVQVNVWIDDPNNPGEKIKSGQMKNTTRNCITYPGYLILKMQEDPESFATIRRVAGVWGFLPLPLPKAKEEDRKPPLALDDEDSARIMLSSSAKQKVLIRENMEVMVLDGLFKDRVAKVVAVPSKNILTLATQVMGQDVKFNLPIEQVQIIEQGGDL